MSLDGQGDCTTSIGRNLSKISEKSEKGYKKIVSIYLVLLFK